MKNRNVEFFNLSFLDLLSGALAAVIFLFIIVPKGEPTVLDDPLSVTYDTLEMKFYGYLPDSISDRQTGDTIFAVIGELTSNPEASAAERADKSERKVKERIDRNRPTPAPVSRTKKPDEEKPEPAEVPKLKSPVAPSKFTGSKPDVPCVLSIEMQWASKKDNVDLFVCKDGECVFGGRRSRSNIGFWDSGKSRTSLFGGDLRTNQEAVRQFDEIIPGTYDILAQYKDSPDPKAELPIRLQVYTKNEDSAERGKEHIFKLSMNPTERTRIAKVTIGPDGEFDFQSFK